MLRGAQRGFNPSDAFRDAKRAGTRAPHPGVQPAQEGHRVQACDHRGPRLVFTEGETVRLGPWGKEVGRGTADPGAADGCTG